MNSSGTPFIPEQSVLCLHLLLKISHQSCMQIYTQKSCHISALTLNPKSHTNTVNSKSSKSWDFPSNLVSPNIWVTTQFSSVAQSCLTLCNPMDCIGHGILQARILQWVAFPFSRGSSQPRDRTWISHVAGRCFNLKSNHKTSCQNPGMAPGDLQGPFH